MKLSTEFYDVLNYTSSLKVYSAFETVLVVVGKKEILKASRISTFVNTQFMMSASQVLQWGIMHIEYILICDVGYIEMTIHGNFS